MTISSLTTRRLGSRQRQATPAEISALAGLAAELGRAGIIAQPTPDQTALLVYRSADTLPVWVFVGDGGGSFCWDSGRGKHPVTDVAGAAVAIAVWMGGEQP